ncbi:Conidiation-specific protein (Con-10), putative [Penicillium digitatum PHI26]|uniref:Conidiation-specific protein (Con-10), putative n=2 Tax=Penicillium digitatum TaxID=36651 RepID=K9FNH2_PEND2|nr:Conidiation-specific protein (Con-10), putative [Penicillium digitatum Pd1]EKV08381.1 Conidiation-specific protein (Con-10), putative [Penicillium digitatum Pd1]EKV09867.1 Conidiation-specific protein (Con-10), putative [Penicillium digitatum PHI26]
MVDNPNPGNFHNRPHEEVENIARKGGQSSHHGGFASMDPNKQVSKKAESNLNTTQLTPLKREIASKGGHASRGKFEPGSPRAKEAGRKGGRSAHQPEE